MGKSHRSAFTLVELAIVLVIIGLLVGGVLVGQQLIRSAKQRAVGARFTRLHLATETFRTKYGQMPGDFNRASSNLACTNCDGNGDGIIENQTGTAISANRYEFSVAMQLMGLAHMIEGEYTGNYTVAQRVSLTDNGYNLPFDRAALVFTTIPNAWGATARLRSRRIICLQTTGGNPCQGPATTLTYPWLAEDAHDLDLKMDDGDARTGKLLADSCNSEGHNWQFDDITIYRSTNATLNYDLTNTTSGCGMIYIL